MYSLIKGKSASNIFIGHAPSLVAAFVIAEVLYKFKSFSAECLAFLVTWFILDWAWTRILELTGYGDRR